MNKVLWVGGIAVIAAGGFAAGVYLTGQQVSNEHQRYVDVITQNYRGTATVASTIDSQFFGAKSTLSLTLLDLPEKVIQWAGTDTVKFNIDYSHGFLSSASVLTLAPGALYDKLAVYQQAPGQPLLQINSRYDYQVSNGRVVVNGDILTDGLTVTDQARQLALGKSTGAFTLTEDSVELNWLFKPSELAVDEMILDVGAIALKQSAQVKVGDVLSAKMSQKSNGSMSIEQLSFTAADAAIAVDDFVLEAKHSVQGERVVVDMDYRSKAIELDDKRNKLHFDNPQLKIAFDLDAVAVLNFAENVQRQQTQPGYASGINDEFVGLLSGITERGINFDVERLSTSIDGQTLVADAQLKMGAFSISELHGSPHALLPKVDLSAQLAVPKKFLAALPSNHSDQLRFMVGMGLLVDDGDRYNTNFMIKKGQISVNGKPL